MSFIIPQSMGSSHDFSNISFTIDIGIEIEEIIEVLNLREGECRIAGNDGFREN